MQNTELQHDFFLCNCHSPILHTYILSKNMNLYVFEVINGLILEKLKSKI